MLRERILSREIFVEQRSCAINTQLFVLKASGTRRNKEFETFQILFGSMERYRRLSRTYYRYSRAVRTESFCYDNTERKDVESR